VRWVFAIYEGIEMRRAYSMAAKDLEPYFAKWEAQWEETEADINNPKIPLGFVMEKGDLMYTDQLELDLKKASTIRSAKTKASADRRTAKKQAESALKKSIDKI
jgi:hypothetical protein